MEKSVGTGGEDLPVHFIKEGGARFHFPESPDRAAAFFGKNLKFFLTPPALLLGSPLAFRSKE